MVSSWVDLLKVALIAAVPIIEVKGAIPFGIAMGFPAVEVLIAALIGSFIPSPLIVYLFTWGLGVLRRLHFRPATRFADWLEQRALKRKGRISKGSLIFLFLFVAIPLPTTGVWTGSMIAALLDIEPKYALPLIFLGNVVASLIMMMCGIIVF